MPSKTLSSQTVNARSTVAPKLTSAASWAERATSKSHALRLFPVLRVVIVFTFIAIMLRSATSGLSVERGPLNCLKRPYISYAIFTIPLHKNPKTGRNNEKR